MKYTDAQRVETFFRQSNGRRVNLREIIDGLHIVEYSGRISDVRKSWGCTCGQDTTTCTADEHIINVAKGYYTYKTNTKSSSPVTQAPVNRGDIESKLSVLRQEYRNAQNDTDKRLIELRAKVLKNTLVKQEPLKSYQTVESDLYKTAMEVLL